MSTIYSTTSTPLPAVLANVPQRSGNFLVRDARSGAITPIPVTRPEVAAMIASGQLVRAQPSGAAAAKARKAATVAMGVRADTQSRALLVLARAERARALAIITLARGPRR